MLKYFFNSAGHIKPTKNVCLMCQGPVCNPPTTPGRTWLSLLWSRLSDQLLTKLWSSPSLWSCQEVVGSGLAQVIVPSMALLPHWVLWDRALFREGMVLLGPIAKLCSLLAPQPLWQPYHGAARPHRPLMFSSSLSMRTYCIFVKQRADSIFEDLIAFQRMQFSAFWCFMREI